MPESGEINFTLDSEKNIVTIENISASAICLYFDSENAFDLKVEISEKNDNENTTEIKYSEVLVVNPLTIENPVVGKSKFIYLVPDDCISANRNYSFNIKNNSVSKITLFK